MFALFKIKMLQRFKEYLADKLSNPIAATLLFIPFAIYYFKLYIRYPEQMSLLDDWFLFIFSLTLLFYGYFIASSKRFWGTCEKYRFVFLTTAVVCIILLFYNFWWSFDFPKKQNSRLSLYGTLNALHIWMLILSILGFAKKYLNFSNRFLQYANQAVYPFYILHQTIIVAIGYYVVQWPMPILLKLIVLAVCCFTTLIIIYKWIIKPFIITRILYGMKWKERKQQQEAAI